jgi:uncharacterized protein
LLSIQENNLHEVVLEERKLLFHIPSTSIFECDPLTQGILDALRSGEHTPDTLESTLAGDFTSESIHSALNDLQSLALVTASAVDSGVKTFEPLELKQIPLTTVVLNINTGCNLSCTYCYKEDLDTPQNQRKMDFDTAVQSIEMLINESPNQERYNVVFFGGEPLSNFALIQRVIDYAEKRFQGLGKKVDFSMTTNATLLDEKTIDYLNAHRVGIAVSMDGPKAYHDRNRITVGGQGTYDTVEKKVGLLLGKYNSRPVGARVTLTTGVTDVVAIWDHLFNVIGFSEVGFAPVTSGDIASYNLQPEELGEVFSGMKQLGERYLEAALENRNIGFSNMHQLITDLHEGNNKALPCGAGVGMVAVDHEGGVNLCHRFTGSELPLLGTVTEGINKPQINEFLNKRLDKADTGCATCRIRNLCAGGCYHESYARYGDPVHPTYHYCDLMRDWVDFGIRVYSTIMEKNPGFYDRYLAGRRAG